MRRFMRHLFFSIGLFTLQPVLAQSNSWTAEYFNNPSLTGAPVAVFTEQSPGHEWGYNAPAAGVPADNFSARWSTNAFLTAGTYQISVKVDDGVRVLVDGVPYINQWQFAAGGFYQGAFTVGDGNHTIVVEYFEAAEIAYLNYNFDRLPDPFAGPRATVTAQFLNVRASPNASAAIMDVISLGQTYPLSGRNASNTWLQLNTGGALGWVNASFMTTGDLFAVPVTDGSSPIPTPVPLPPPGATAQITAYRLNVRNAPNPYTGGVITQISRNDIYSVVGRNLDTSWVQINVGGLIGWVRSSWTILTNIAAVPVTSNTTNPSQPPPTTPTATVQAYFLNTRSAPYFGAPILTIVARGWSYPVIGRNGDSSWVQINVGGIVGWVRSTWVTVSPGLGSVPVTG